MGRAPPVGVLPFPRGKKTDSMPSCIPRHILEPCLKNCDRILSVLRKDVGGDQECLGERLSTQERTSHGRSQVKAHSHLSPWAQLADFTEATSLQWIAITQKRDPKMAQKPLFPACPSLLGLYCGSETTLHSLRRDGEKSFWGQTGNTIKARREAAASACGNGQSLPKGKIPYSVMSCLTSRREGMGSMATWRRVVPR